MPIDSAVLRPFSLLTALCCTAALFFAATASAEDSIYWSNVTGGNLGLAALTGGGSDLVPSPALAEEPFGSGIDATTGKIYWGDAGTNKIKFANLDGTGSAVLPTTGAEVNLPNSTVVDVATGRVYWANAGGRTISWANLDGSGGGNLNTGVAPIEEPYGIAIDPAANRIYWANFGLGSIAYANLDGTGGGGELAIPAGLVEEPDALAIDQVTSRIYWANFEEGSGSGAIGWAGLSGVGAELLPITPGLVIEPGGLAIGEGRIYWTNERTAAGIFAAASNGSGGVKLDTTGATIASPSYPSLLTKPRGAPQPQFITVDELGATLSCPTNPFEADDVAAHLYRVPTTVSYTWIRGSAAVASGATLTPAAPGDYTCQVTGTNAAGSTTVSKPFSVAAKPATKTETPPVVSATVKLTKVKYDKRHGTATLLATLSGPGKLTLTGKNVVRRTVKAAGVGVAKLEVAAKGKALKKLRKTGKVKVQFAVRFVASEGASASASRSLTLRLIPKR